MTQNDIDILNEEYEERIAIMMYDGNVSEDEAITKARQCFSEAVGI